jgi:hypothetical protein
MTSRRIGTSSRCALSPLRPLGNANYSCVGTDHVVESGLYKFVVDSSGKNLNDMCICLYNNNYPFLQNKLKESILSCQCHVPSGS